MIINAEGILKKTGYPRANRTKLGKIRTLFITGPNFTFSSVTDFETYSQWISDIKAESIVFFSKISQVENQTEETTYVNSELDYEYRGKKGKYRYLLRTVYEKQYHDHIEAMSGKDVRVFIADVNNNIAANQVASSVRGLDVELLNVEKKKFADTGAQWTQIYLVLSDPDEFNLVSQMTWNPNTINLVHVTLSSISGSGSTIDFTIKDSVFDIPIQNLYESDITITDGEGGISVSSLAETDCGEYRLTATGALSVGSINVNSDRFFGSAQYIVNQTSVIFNNFTFESANLFQVDVRLSGDLALYTGLLLADFTMVDDTNGAVTIISVTEVSSGRYEINTSTNLTTGDISVDDGSVTGTGSYATVIEVEAYAFDTQIINSGTINCSVREVTSGNPVAGLTSSAFSIVDDVNGSVLLSVTDEGGGDYSFTLSGPRTTGEVFISEALYDGSGRYNYGNCVFVNTGILGCGDWENPDVNGVPEYVSVTSPSTNEVSTPTRGDFTGLTLLVKQKTIGSSVNINMLANTFKEGTQYQLKFFYEINNAGTGADRFVYIYLIDDDGVEVLNDTITQAPTIKATYTSSVFSIASSSTLLLKFAWDRFDMEVRLDEIQLIEV